MNYFLIFSLFFAAGTAENTSLRLVHVFFRHGSRTPELKDAFPTDPFTIETFSPMGWGQLTNAGKERAYKLGRLLHRRYHDFLGDTYTPELLQSFSTDFDRTKMSLLLVQAGLFPPSPSQSWHSEIPWLPIPYHYDKDKYDYTLRRPTKYCPTYVKELEEVLASAEAQRLLKSNRKLMQYVSKHTNVPINKLIDLFSVYQTLTAEANMNLTLPEWTKSVYPAEIHEAAAKQCEFENYNPILKRLNGGRMLAKVIANMVEKSNGSALVHNKIVLYSGHENNVINMLAALNLFEAHVPSYSSAVIIELHYVESTKQYAVKVYYSRDVNEEPEVQKLEGCDVLCPLNNFIQITEPHVPVNYTAECHSHVNLH